MTDTYWDVFEEFLHSKGIYEQYVHNRENYSLSVDVSLDTPQLYVVDAFSWSRAEPEMYQFWCDIHCEWVDLLIQAGYRG